MYEFSKDFEGHIPLLKVYWLAPGLPKQGTFDNMLIDCDFTLTFRLELGITRQSVSEASKSESIANR